MISSLLDLETRRKILFADDHLTIRSLGADGALLTIASTNIPRHSIENVQRILAGQRELNSISKLIIDISKAENISILEIVTSSRLKCAGLQRFAVSSKKITHRLLLLPLKLIFQSVEFRLFKNLTNAIAWTKS